ncbi:50S ribosomal protein L25 [Candidatus Purcelliella pentastirinorum]|uniref:Large ribosomal subunit protein bL25 n=1 Tax=Candidatus Purcelliella pentastirinorum TaxID=472834 RepID=A0AAX3N7Y3_9ENTR|nr:50S ribosomal protein L25 [Candidatus Purcelliella pentastirinorum]WDI78488.1 50S ribosomal protein L25 [Candidatus Purcelliella pentastirinorum]WDR80483.1 50S ribosomal protein L25 [Candidatus Purcelliella pentastirinorum]
MLIIKAEIRKKINKNKNKQLRKIKKIPAVIYGKNKKNININIEEKIITNIKNKYNLYKKKIIIKINNIEEIVHIQSIQQHPYKENIIHIDFLYTK